MSKQDTSGSILDEKDLGRRARELHEVYCRLPTPELIIERARLDKAVLSEEMNFKELNLVLSERNGNLIQGLGEIVSGGETSFRTLRANYLLSRLFSRNEVDLPYAEMHGGIAEEIYLELLATCDTDSDKIVRYGEKLFGMNERPSGILVGTRNINYSSKPSKGAAFVDIWGEKPTIN